MHQSGALPFDPQTLRSAGYAEIQRIIEEEDQPYTEVVCHFCNEKYHFYPADMQRILEAAN